MKHFEYKKENPLRKTILVVDDEEDLLEILRCHLEDEGYHVMTASNGREGLEIMMLEKPDLILLDIGMPKMGGLEMLETLKGMKGFAATPVVMLTAQGQSSHILETDRLRAADFLIKPFTHEELLQAVRKVL
jgi:DNA-binding response OmpR family regulator